MFLALSGCPMSWDAPIDPIPRVPHGSLEEWSQEHWNIRGGPSLALEEAYGATDLTPHILWDDSPE